jgi:hypothetical protein
VSEETRGCRVLDALNRVKETEYFYFTSRIEIENAVSEDQISSSIFVLFTVTSTHPYTSLFCIVAILFHFSHPHLVTLHIPIRLLFVICRCMGPPLSSRPTRERDQQTYLEKSFLKKNLYAPWRCIINGSVTWKMLCDDCNIEARFKQRNSRLQTDDTRSIISSTSSLRISRKCFFFPFFCFFLFWVIKF